MTSDKSLIELSKKVSVFLRQKADKNSGSTEKPIDKPLIFYVDGINGKHPVIIFSSFKCNRYLQGHCAPCLYSNIPHYCGDKDSVYRSLIKQADYVLDNFNELILSKQKQEENSGVFHRFEGGHFVSLELCGEGSFLSNSEIPREFREKILDRFTRLSEKNRINMQLIAESKVSDFLENHMEFEGKSDWVKGFNFTVLFGFESVNDFTRNVVYNKGVEMSDFEKAVGIAKDMGIRVAVFLFCGHHSMTQKEIIEDVKESIRYFRSNGIATYLMLPNIQPYTLNHLLYHYSMHSTLDPWTVVELVKMLVEGSFGAGDSHYFNGHDWSIGGLTTIPEPLFFLFSNKKRVACDSCTREIADMVHELVTTYDVGKFLEKERNMTCQCRGKYEEAVAKEEASKRPLRKRVEEALRFADEMKKEYASLRHKA